MFEIMRNHNVKKNPIDKYHKYQKCAVQLLLPKKRFLKAFFVILANHKIFKISITEPASFRGENKPPNTKQTLDWSTTWQHTVVSDKQFLDHRVFIQVIFKVVFFGYDWHIQPVLFLCWLRMKLHILHMCMVSPCCVFQSAL